MDSVCNNFIQMFVDCVNTMMEQTHTDPELTELPTELNSAQGKLVYLYLEATDGATVDELGQVLSMRKIDILSVCNSLSSQQLIEKCDGTYVPTR